MTLLTNIGESVSGLSKYSKKLLPKDDLKKITGFRNRAVHDYAGLDSFLVFDIIKNDLEVLKKNLFEILKKLKEENFIALEEYLTARESGFYKFIDFGRIDLILDV